MSSPVFVRAHAVDRSQWTELFDFFSRRHEGWLVSVSVESPGSRDRRYVSFGVPLHGIVAELDEGRDAVMVFTGGAGAHEGHFIRHPVSLVADDSVEEADVQLTITDRDGDRTTIEIFSPMLPELVDGML